MESDICRICRCEGTTENALYHPCKCTGSIRYIHQDCLTQWLNVSRKNKCEVCNHRFSFVQIYAANMPKKLPLIEVLFVFFKCLFANAYRWFFRICATFMNIFIIPTIAYRTYDFIFNFPNESLLGANIITGELHLMHCFCGAFSILCSSSTFIFIFWLWDQLFENPIRHRILRLPERITTLVELIVLPFLQNFVIRTRNALNNNFVLINAFQRHFNQVNLNNMHPEFIFDALIQNENFNIDLAGGEQPEQGGAYIRKVKKWINILKLSKLKKYAFNWIQILGWNALFVFVFAFCPAVVGGTLLKYLKINTIISEDFDRFIYIFTGYLIITTFAFILASFYNFRRYTLLDDNPVVFMWCISKLVLVVLIRVVIFPTVIGWWLDFCSLPLTSHTTRDLIDSFHANPIDSCAIHWVIGIICVIHFNSFLQLMDEVIKPKIFATLTLKPTEYYHSEFLNNEDLLMIVHNLMERSTITHVLQSMAITTSIAIISFLTLFIPISLIQHVMPSFMFTTNISTIDSPLSPLAIEIVLFQIFIPFIADDRYELRKFVRTFSLKWLKFFGSILKIQRYLLHPKELPGAHDEDIDPIEIDINEPAPKYLPLRLFGLFVAFSLTLHLFGLYFFIFPLFYGRVALSVWFDSSLVHELNTATYGLYSNVVLHRTCFYLYRKSRLILSQVRRRFFDWLPICAKLSVLCFVLLFITPLFLGVMFDVIVLMPLRVPLNQTPIFLLGQDFAFGIVLTYIICAVLVLTNRRFRLLIEHLFENGVADLNVKRIIFQIAMPLLSTISLILTLPYIVTETLLSAFEVSFEIHNLVIRHIHFTIFLLLIVVLLIKYQINKFIRFYEHYRNDRYLLERRPVNYEPDPAAAAAVVH